MPGPGKIDRFYARRLAGPEMAGHRDEECRPGFLPDTTKSRLPRWPWLIRPYRALPPAYRAWGKPMFLVAVRPR